MLDKCLLYLDYRRCLLTDSNINADTVLPLLVYHRVDGNRRLARAAVADNQFALAASDRNKCVDSLDTRLQRLVNRLSVRDARRRTFNFPVFRCFNGSLAVDGTTQRIHDAPDHRFADRHLHDAARTLDRVAFHDLGLATENDGAHVVLLQVQHQAENIISEIEQLAGHCFLQAMNMSDAVTDFDNSPHLVNLKIHFIVLDLLFDDGCYFFGIHFHNLALTSIPNPPKAVLRVPSCGF